MPANRRLSDLSAPRQSLVRLCQALNYGQIQMIEVRNGEPMLGSARVFTDLNLTGEDSNRPQGDLADFALRNEVCMLMVQIDELGNGIINRLDVRAGIPRRVLIQRHLGNVSQ
jgi:hypothetical protein